MREWLAAALGSLFLAGSSTGAALPRMEKQMGKERPATSSMQMMAKDRPASSTKTGQAIDPACIAAAVATRETALATVVSTQHQSIATAYAARATALNTAYAGTDAKTIKENVKKAWDTFAESKKNAKQTAQRGRDNTWNTFKSAAKACKGSESISDARNASLDQQ